MPRTTPVLALLLLCMLWAFASLRSDLFPGSVPSATLRPLAGEALTFAILAVLAAITAIAQKAQWPRERVLGVSVLIALGVFIFPALIIATTKGRIDDSTRLALFSLAPIFAVVLEPYLNPASLSQQRGSLAAALAAVSGTLLIFPVELPQSATATLAFSVTVIAVASVSAANCIAVRAASNLPSRSLFSFAAVVAGTSAICLAVLSGVLEGHTFVGTFQMDGWTALPVLSFALLFWLMRRMTAVRMTTRYLIAPLIANLISLAFLRPQVELRIWLGLVLIALGSGWLLLAPAGEPEQTGSSLGIN